MNEHHSPLKESNGLFKSEEVGFTYESRGRTISDADIIIHGGQIGDFSSIHFDDEMAKTTSYGRRIVFGTFIFSLATGLKYGMDERVRINYGYEKVRFIKPVFIGDTLRIRVTVVESGPDPRKSALWRVVEKTEVLNQRAEVVMSCNHILVHWTSLEAQTEKPKE